MGKNSRQRRDARRRSHPRGTRITPAGQQTLSQPEVISLIDIASRYAVDAPRALAPRVEQLNALGAVATSPHHDPAALVVDEVLSRLRAAWEHGWQPADLVHATRRRTSGPAAAWIARAVLVEAGQTDAATRAPQEWVDQLVALGSEDQHEDPDALLATSGRASLADWTAALVVLDFVHRLPRSQLLAPPPSAWGSTPTARPRPTGPRAQGEHHAKTLTKIRALLAKAESTEFAAEAEAFTAKAQDLMTRHAIDEALLADQAGSSVHVRSVRVLIHQPYAMEKATLLDVVARANRTRAIWNDFAAVVTLVGVPTDVAQVEMLFTSTLVQATRAMTQAGRSGTDRSTSFRKAFLIAYATRIGERLEASDHAASAEYGSALVPVLERQAEAVGDEFARLFPHVTTGSRRRSFDARGWDAGTRAADDAALPAGEVEG